MRQEVPKAALAGALAFVGRETKNDPASLKGVSVSYQHYELLVDGVQMRFTLWPGKKAERESPKPSEVAVFDGKHYKRILVPSEKTQSVGGMVLEHNRIISDLSRCPLLWMLRPNEKAIIPNISGFLVEQDVAHPSLVSLRQPVDNNLRKQTILWVDPAKDFAVVRIAEIGVPGKNVVQQMDISYKKDKDQGWLPISWSTSFPLGKGILTEESKVEEYEFNAAIAKERFLLEFPPDMPVFDSTRKKLESRPR